MAMGLMDEDDQDIIIGYDKNVEKWVDSGTKLMNEDLVELKSIQN